MIETHAHIYDEKYDEDRTEMLQRAWDVGITQIWMPNCDHSTIPGMMQLAEDYPGRCLPMMGLHPTYVKEGFEKELQLVEEWLDKYKFIAIGEIGMDLFWDKTFREQQEEAFLFQCALAQKHNLWIDIHCREAFWETVSLIEKFGDSAPTGIFHCFTGTLEEAEKVIELGFKIGVGGVATFKNGGLDKVIPHIGLEHIVLETDSPYLAPTPFRGKRNEVVYIDLVAQKVADLKQIPKDEVVALTDKTALSLLGYKFILAISFCIVIFCILMSYNKIQINPISPEPTQGSVLVIYTGGTFGMVYEARDKQLVPFNFDQIFEKVPEISRLNFELTFLSLHEPIDSSNISPEIWIELAGIIGENYAAYDSFVILHGTDTMAYTASALSYLLENLNKPVILTGAQLPIGVARSDARENFITALELAAATYPDGKPIVTEVCIYFNSVLLRGNRAKKKESSNFNAFISENYPHLANAGVRIDYNFPFLRPFETGKEFHVHKKLDTQVAFLKMFPGINQSVVRSVLKIDGLKGVVLETYGSGNAMTDAWFQNEIRQAINSGIIIFNVSQCYGGRVNQGQYQTSKFLKQAGVVSGSDITAEAAITKMMYVFGKEADRVKCIDMLKKPLCGEMSV